MSKMYTIKHTISSSGGLQTATLNIDNFWCIATAQPKKFASPKEASEYYMGENNIPASGTGVWIEGPYGGGYGITDAKRIRNQ